MFHARIYPGTKAPSGMGSPYMTGASNDKKVVVTGMYHERCYPGKATPVDMGSPYVTKSGSRAPSTRDNPRPKGKPNLESSSDPLAIRTSGFA